MHRSGRWEGGRRSSLGGANQPGTYCGWLRVSLLGVSGETGYSRLPQPDLPGCASLQDAEKQAKPAARARWHNCGVLRASRGVEGVKRAGGQRAPRNRTCPVSVTWRVSPAPLSRDNRACVPSPSPWRSLRARGGHGANSCRRRVGPGRQLCPGQLRLSRPPQCPSGASPGLHGPLRSTPCTPIRFSALGARRVLQLPGLGYIHTLFFNPPWPVPPPGPTL